jgi:antitoxin VapB
MTTVKIFQSGNNQVLRLPKQFRFNSDRVEIFRRGDEIVMREAPVNAAAIFDVLTDFPDDFMCSGREDFPPQECEPF